MNEPEFGKIILASASPRRSELLGRANVPFEVEVSRAQEDNDPDADPREAVLANAKLKAEEVARRFPGRLVLGADTVVAFGGKVFGKPKDIADAKRMLGILNGNTHSVFTGVAAVCAKPDGAAEIEADVEESKVTFKKLSPEGIDEYLSKVNTLDKAGSYAAQEFGELIIERIDGAFDNVMGLPCALAQKKLDTLGKRVQDAH